MAKRKNKSTSYNLESVFELELLKHAEKPEHGDYSSYIKRLVYDDKRRVEGAQMQVNVPMPIIEKPKADFSSFI